MVRTQSSQAPISNSTPRTYRKSLSIRCFTLYKHVHYPLHDRLKETRARHIFTVKIQPGLNVGSRYPQEWNPGFVGDVTTIRSGPGWTLPLPLHRRPSRTYSATWKMHHGAPLQLTSGSSTSILVVHLPPQSATSGTPIYWRGFTPEPKGRGYTQSRQTRTFSGESYTIILEKTAFRVLGLGPDVRPSGVCFRCLHVSERPITKWI